MPIIKNVYNLSEVTAYTPEKLPEISITNKITSKDLIGIEVEVENVQATRMKLNPVWSVKQDGSLRNGGLEFVTAPIEAHYASAALHNLLNEYMSSERCFSPRTSVHIHLNMMDFEIEQAIDFLVLYSIFEKLLYRFAGRGRIKNIYCVPATETNQLRYFLQNGLGRGRDVWSKYSGLNLACLRQYGTVEFRHMHGTSDIEKLSAWIGLITALKEYVRNTPVKETRVMLFQMNDMNRFEELMLSIFGDYAKHLKYKGIEDVREPYQQAKLVCLKNTAASRILTAVSLDAPFFKGIK